MLTEAEGKGRWRGRWSGDGNRIPFALQLNAKQQKRVLFAVAAGADVVLDSTLARP